MSKSISLCGFCPIYNFSEQEENQMNAKEAQDKLEALEHLYSDYQAKYNEAVDVHIKAEERVEAVVNGENVEEITKAVNAAYWALREEYKMAKELDDISQLLFYEQNEIACARTLSNYSLKELLYAVLDKLKEMPQDEVEISFTELSKERKTEAKNAD
jgi:glutathionyl-hydroquinone reductase